MTAILVLCEIVCGFFARTMDTDRHFVMKISFLSMYDQHVRNCMKLFLGEHESTFTTLSIRLTMRSILVVVVCIEVRQRACSTEIAQNERSAQHQHQRTRKAAFSLLMSEFFPQAHKNPHTIDMTHSTTC